MPIAEFDELRDRFVATLRADVNSLIRLYRNDAATPGRPGEWLRAIKRSAIVLIAANLENFVEDLVCAGLTHLVDQRVRARSYPEAFRVWRFRQDAHMRSLSVEDSRELVDLSLKLYSEVRELQGDELMLDEIRREFANPTAANINWIVGLLDKPDYVNNLTVTVNGQQTGVRSALQELARRRNAIAHGDAGQNPSIEDVERLAKFAQVFSTRIKRDVTSAIETCLR